MNDANPFGPCPHDGTTEKIIFCRSCVRWATDEINRLRAELDEAKDEIGSLRSQTTGLQTLREIERAAADALAGSDVRMADAIDMAVRYGGIDGSHHKAWVIDQMVRILTGCPTETREATDVNGTPYTYTFLGESDEYRSVVAQACDGEDGPNTYDWDVGTPP